MALLIEEHYRKLERLYAAAPINDYYKPSLKVSEGRAEVRIPLQPKMFHAAHAVHGSIYFKALDDAAFFAANSLVEEVFVLTASFHIHLLSPIAAGEITARGHVVHQSGRLFVAEAELEDGEGNPLARGSGTFMRSRIPLGPEVGYE